MEFGLELVFDCVMVKVHKTVKQGWPIKAHEDSLSGPFHDYKTNIQRSVFLKSHFDPINLITKSIICDSERGDDFFFGDYLIFGQHSTFSNVTDRYFPPTLS